MCRRIDLSALDLAQGQFEQSFHYRSDEGKAYWTGCTPEAPDVHPHMSVTGTCDLLQVKPDELIVSDWKFGRPDYTTPATRNKQLLFYALCAWLSRGDHAPDKISGQLVFIDPETGGVKRQLVSYTTEQFVLLQRQIAQILIERRESDERLSKGVLPNVREGAHCNYCPARMGCPAKVSLIRQFSQGLVLRPAGEITPTKVGEVWVKAQSIKRALQDLERQLSHWVKNHGKHIELPNGRKLGVQKRQGNEVLDADTSEEVVKEMVGLDASVKIVKKSVTKKAILEAVKAAGKSNSLATEVVDTIRKAGGVTRRKDSELVKEF